MRKSVAVLQVFSLAASLVLLQKFVFAENPKQSESHPPKQSESHLIQEAAAVSMNSTETFWSPEKMKKAKPLLLPRSYNGVVTGATS